MITRITRKPLVQFDCHKPEHLEDVLLFAYLADKGRKYMASLPMPVSLWNPQLVQSLEQTTSLRIQLVEASNQLWGRRPMSPDNKEIQPASRAYMAWRDDYMPVKEECDRVEDMARQLTAEMLDANTIQIVESSVLLLKPRGHEEENNHALYRGSLWRSKHDLTEDQWARLIDRFLDRERIELEAALGEGDDPLARERIPSHIRRAVWTRDQGKCARCGSRENLEFDHIVPVSRGGSNTERNVELLCEPCNRSKSDTID